MCGVGASGSGAAEQGVLQAGGDGQQVKRQRAPVVQQRQPRRTAALAARGNADQRSVKDGNRRAEAQPAQAVSREAARRRAASGGGGDAARREERQVRERRVAVPGTRQEGLEAGEARV